MVRAGEQEQEGYRSKLFNFRGMFDSNAGKHTKSLSVDAALNQQLSTEDGSASSKSQGSNSDKIPKAKVISKEEIAAKEAREKLLQGSISDTNIIYLLISFKFGYNIIFA